MGFEWPLETEPAEALPIKASDFLGAWQTGAKSLSGRQSAQSRVHASPNTVLWTFEARHLTEKRQFTLSASTCGRVGAAARRASQRSLSLGSDVRVNYTPVQEPH